MKKIFFLFCALIFSISLFPQTPQGINYQGVARDPGGAAISNANIGIEFKIWDGNPSSGGSMIYSEVHSSVATDTFGLYTSVIGSTSGSGTGTFNSINWSTGNKWIEVYIDPTGTGSAYALVSSSQLMSVPYALYAATSGSGGGGGSVSGQPNNIPRINNAGNGLGRSLISQSSDSMSIGINNISPMADAVLDIVNTGAPGGAGKGILIPRMTFAERSAISVSSLHHGLLVFQTNSGSALTPEGFWYYDAVNSTWLLLAPAQAVWTMSGNAAGTSGFLGTLDDNDIIFKTGFITATERMRVLSNAHGGNVQFGNSSLGTHYIFPAAKGNAGDILQLDPSGTNNLFWKPAGSGAATWVRNGGLVTTLNATDTVGIGTNAPKAMLDVRSNNVTGAVLASSLGSEGGAGKFLVMNPANDSAALMSYTKGKGPAFVSVSQGTGNGGVFAVNNSSSFGNGILAGTDGNGKAVFGINTGLGYGGAFYISNASNDSAAVVGSTLGKGPAVFGFNAGLGNGGTFQILNSLNSNSAVNATTNGTGTGISVSSNSGNAIDATNVGGAHTINAKNNGAGGNAGNFVISSTSNGNAAVGAVTNGSGSAVDATSNGMGAAVKAVNTSAGGLSGDFSGGAGLRTDKISITGGAQVGLILTSSNTNGDAFWSPVPGSINFGVAVSTTSQTFAANTNTVTVNLGTVGYSNPPTLISGNTFTSPSAGFYHLDAQITIVNGGPMSGGTVVLSLQDPVSGTIYKQVQYNAPSAGSFSQSLAISTDLQLNSGQKVVLSVSNTSTGTSYTSITNPVLSWFNGHKVY
ncbi:MAG: beta strand repeat-containing protein [Bacteroidia bacterium]